MLLLIFSCAVLTAPPDAGRVEVEGLVITAVARPSPFGRIGPEAGKDLEVQFDFSTKAGSPMPIVLLEGPVHVFDFANKSIAVPSRNGFGKEPRSTGTDRWTVQLSIDEAVSKKLAVVEGTISVAPSQRMTVTFEGNALKTNSVVPMDGGIVKLTVLDVDDGLLDVRFRLSLPALSKQRSPLHGASATLIDAQGKETALSSQGMGVRGDGVTFDHRLRFGSDKKVKVDALRTLRLELPMANAPSKKVNFRIRDVPVDDSKWPRKAGP